MCLLIVSSERPPKRRRIVPRRLSTGLGPVQKNSEAHRDLSFVWEYCIEYWTHEFPASKASSDRPLLKHLFWSSNHNLPSISIRRDLQVVPIRWTLSCGSSSKPAIIQTYSFCLFPSGRLPQGYTPTNLTFIKSMMARATSRRTYSHYAFPTWRQSPSPSVMLFQKSLEGPALDWFTSLASHILKHEQRTVSEASRNLVAGDSAVG